MSEVKLDAFRKSLKEGNLAPCYILYGEERYLREHYARELRQAVLGRGDDPFNLRRYDGKNLDLEELADAVDAYPAFGERTLVELRDFDLFQCTEERAKKLISLLKGVPDYCCLVFQYDTLDYKPDRRKKALCEAIRQYASSVEFPVQTPGELQRWIQRHFKSHQKEISAEDAGYLLFLCGSQMENLRNEIGKIAVYAREKRIGRGDIDAVVVPVVEAEAFRLTDALAQRDYEKAAELMHKLFQLNTEPIMLNALIGSQLRKMYAAKLVKQQGGSVAQLADVLNTGSEYMPKQYLRICGSFSADWYRAGIRRSAETDFQMKSSGADPEALLCSLFLWLAVQQA